jgi:hypothetical protein
MTLIDTTPATSDIAPAKVRPTGGFAHESTVNESVEWYTPPSIFEKLGIRFDLDPCSPGAGKSFVPADNHYTIVDDGLASPWFGTVWVNPPYGKHTPVWMEKLAEHGDGIALVFARTDVAWFHEFGTKADVVCFVRSRVKFFQGDMETQPGTPGAGSMLLAYGPKAAAALRQSGLGACFSLSN